MKERPIPFRAEMVRALLAGTKTQTRRVVKPRHDWHVDEVPDDRGVFRPWPVFEAYVYAEPETVEVPCPYGAPGDQLWVRETVKRVTSFGPNDAAIYAADGETTDLDSWGWQSNTLPPMFMPRGLSRITLEVTEVRVQRLQAISEADAIAEGIERNDDDGVTYYGPLGKGHFDPRVAYRWLWETINGAGSWEANPWVWVISFRRLETEKKHG